MTHRAVMLHGSLTVFFQPSGGAITQSSVMPTVLTGGGSGRAA